MYVVIQPKHMSQNTGNIIGLVRHIKRTNLTKHGTQMKTLFFFMLALNKPFVQGFRAEPKCHVTGSISLITQSPSVNKTGVIHIYHNALFHF